MERPILFTPANIRAILEGRKTQTRRVIKPQPMDGKFPHEANGEWGLYLDRSTGGPYQHIGKCTHGLVGDRLWVTEGVIIHCGIPELIGYYMDGCRATEHWMERRTAMFMPKWAARTWLEITEVRVERVQDISEEDAQAEGTSGDPLQKAAISLQLTHNWDASHPYRSGYGYLWDSINGKKHPWASNPWVWALTFRKL